MHGMRVIWPLFVQTVLCFCFFVWSFSCLFEPSGERYKILRAHQTTRLPAVIRSAVRVLIYFRCVADLENAFRVWDPSSTLAIISLEDLQMG